MSDFELPTTSPPFPLNRAIDSTPNEDFPIRILQAYRQDCDCKYQVSGLPAERTRFWEMMNEWQDQRAKILDQSISVLESVKTGFRLV